MTPPWSAWPSHQRTVCPHCQTSHWSVCPRQLQQLLLLMPLQWYWWRWCRRSSKYGVYVLVTKNHVPLPLNTVFCLYATKFIILFLFCWKNNMLWSELPTLKKRACSLVVSQPPKYESHTFFFPITLKHSALQTQSSSIVGKKERERESC